MSAPHMRLKSAFRQRSVSWIALQGDSPWDPAVRDRRACLFVTRALLRIAGPVETSSLDDLRATVKEARSTPIPPFPDFVTRAWQLVNRATSGAVETRPVAAAPQDCRTGKSARFPGARV